MLDFLFYRCKRYIQNAAIDRATQLLDNTAERINGIMSETEVVTNYMAVTTPRHLAPDSLLAFTRQITELNSVMQGFTIALEPGVLPGVDQFTASSYHTADSLVSLLKNDYDYFLHPWYKTPVESNAGCWLEPYRYAVPDIDPEPVWYFSYTTPLRDIDGRLIGVACADLSDDIYEIRLVDVHVEVEDDHFLAIYYISIVYGNKRRIFHTERAYFLVQKHTNIAEK